MMAMSYSVEDGLLAMAEVMLQHATSSTQHEALWEKVGQVRAILRGYGRVIIAFSGGVDSTLLVKLARDVLGKNQVLAATADSPSLAREDLEATRLLALELNVEHWIIPTHEMEDPAYRANTPNRCYCCKRELFQELDVIAREQGISVVLYGAIGDDQGADRPGQQAAAERGVRAPLQEVGLAKWEVREVARHFGLSNWDRPQNACLASRIPHGEEVTEEKLKQIEDAEAVLRAQGFQQVRVRHLGSRARIEVEAGAVHRFNDPCLQDTVSRALEVIGFDSISIDPAGYRPGGANNSPP